MSRVITDVEWPMTSCATLTSMSASNISEAAVSRRVELEIR
jgi:hypothetical protein